MGKNRSVTAWCHWEWILIWETQFNTENMNIYHTLFHILCHCSNVFLWEKVINTYDHRNSPYISKNMIKCKHAGGYYNLFWILNARTSKIAFAANIFGFHRSNPYGGTRRWSGTAKIQSQMVGYKLFDTVGTNLMASDVDFGRCRSWICVCDRLNGRLGHQERRQVTLWRSRQDFACSESHQIQTTAYHHSKELQEKL